MSKFNPETMNVIMATDCGSTTSKARFFKKLGKEYRLIACGEAPTTVEAPFEDVTLGVRNAIREVEELTGHRMLDEKGILTPCRGGNNGVDLYITTSSAGGGLQMLVTGIMKSMTAESAERAALGAGALVMDVMAIDDGRKSFEKIRRIRFLRPDMILISGGTDGGNVRQVVETVDLIVASEPKSRLGTGFQIPVVYAGNKNGREDVERSLSDKYALTVVDNIRPVLEDENTAPAREAIHACFMEHVMSHAPGYVKLMNWTEVPIMPTPAAEGKMFQTIAESYHANVIGVGLGGATTNIYSIYGGRFVRTVSANLGMSYSICNVLKESGIKNIMRWIPFKIDEYSMREKLLNKMIRPTTIPETMVDLLIEHAVAREAIRLAFAHHKFLARPLRGIQRMRDTVSVFDQRTFEETYIDMMRIQWLAGTGGLLSHAPRRNQSALLLIDAFQPEGVTKLAQDSVFMIPHLGVLSTVHPKASMDIFEKDCLVRLGTCIAPRGQPKKSGNDLVLTVKVRMPDGALLEEKLLFGTIKRVPLKEGQKAEVEIKPASNFDIGTGSGHTLATTVEGGVVGIIIDARGRPLVLFDDENERRKQLFEWFRAMDTYSDRTYQIG